MDYNKYAKDVLSNEKLLNLLPDRKIYRIKASSNHNVPYCTYRFYDDPPAFCAEGKVKKTRYYIQIDINSDSDFTEIEKVIRNLCESEGWEKGAIYEDIDPNTNLFFKCMRYTFDL